MDVTARKLATMEERKGFDTRLLRKERPVVSNDIVIKNTEVITRITHQNLVVPHEKDSNDDEGSKAKANRQPHVPITIDSP